MAERGKKKKSEEGGGAPEWMVTFSDLVTLLLTFFVLLLSMANMDKIKFKAAAASLKSAFGVMGTVEQREIAPPKIIEIPPLADDLQQRVYKQIKSKMLRLKLDKDVELVKDRGAVVLRVNDAVLFAAGQTAIRPEAYDTLKKVAAMVRGLPFHMRIEGHSDAMPFTSVNEGANWDLSVFRALAVLKFFALNDLFPIDRMSATGYGSQRPLLPNDSPENRAANRRVEFFLENTASYTEELPFLIDAQDQFPF